MCEDPYRNPTRPRLTDHRSISPSYTLIKREATSERPGFLETLSARRRAEPPQHDPPRRDGRIRRRPPPLLRPPTDQDRRLPSLLHSSLLQNHQWTRCRPPPLRVRPPAAISGRRTDGGGTFDPELRSVLELATDEELYELESILFGPSYFSPLLKSIMNKPDVGDEIHGEDYEAREDFIEHLESRFLFLAADARSTLRGWRPSYRSVLLGVRRKLGVPCSSKLSTGDLEAEIYLHLLHEYSSQEIHSSSWDEIKFSNSHGNLELGVNHWKGHSLAALKVGAEELKSMILKGGGLLSVAKIYQLLARRLSGKMFLEAANYQIRHELLKKGGQLAAINLESRTALLVARQGLARAASRYFGLRSLMTLVGPVLWGTLLADIVIQMMGTDYARILQAITAFAQIRLTRTYGWTSNED